MTDDDDDLRPPAGSELAIARFPRPFRYSMCYAAARNGRSAAENKCTVFLWQRLSLSLSLAGRVLIACPRPTAFHRPISQTDSYILA